jgi:hypothetical protein
MHEMLAGIPRAGAENPQRVPDDCRHCNRLITFDTPSEDRNIRRALVRATEEKRPDGRPARVLADEIAKALLAVELRQASFDAISRCCMST